MKYQTFYNPISPTQSLVVNDKIEKLVPVNAPVKLSLAGPLADPPSKWYSMQKFEPQFFQARAKTNLNHSVNKGGSSKGGGMAL